MTKVSQYCKHEYCNSIKGKPLKANVYKGSTMRNSTMQKRPIKKHFLAKSLLALSIFSLSQISYANTPVDITTSNNALTQQQGSSSKQAVKTFYLNLWAPDQVAPAEAIPVEYGVNYQYRYTPESHEVQADAGEQLIAFEFHPDLKKRYQFRWVSADQPQLVSFDKVKKRKMKVKIDAGATEQDQDVYFEVWVYDTLTGEVLMCDPKVIVIS